MKLTKVHKEAFVRSVMNDVPEPAKFQEELDAAVLADMIAHAPVKALKVALANKEMLPFLVTGNDNWRPDSVSVDCSVYRMYDIGLSSVAVYSQFTASDKLKKSAGDIMRRAAGEYIKRKKLQSKVTVAIAACSTVKQVTELLPEFVKYLPEVAVEGTMLPMVANLSAELTMAGWPKKAYAVTA